MKKQTHVICFTLFFLFTTIPNALSQGLIIEEAEHHGQEGISLPVTRYQVSTEIRDQIADTVIEQTFHNPHNRRIEATYVMAVPEKASISSFTMNVNGKPVKGEILDKDKAEKAYQEIVRKLKDPGILSFSGRGLIRARIFPIEPNSDPTIKIQYEEVLVYDKGVCRYQCALASDKLQKKPLDFVKIKVKINSNTPIKNLYSPTHDIQVTKDSNLTAKVKYSDENILPEHDFQLFLSVSPDPIGLNVLTYKEKGEKGFFLLLASPPVVNEDEAIPKDVIFVLDKSGSMKTDHKIEQAKKALEFCVQSLNPKDRFAVIAFSDEIDRLAPLTAAEKDHVEEICKEIHKIEARGGTNIHSALKQAFQSISHDDRPRYILFLTDGKPTVGVREIPKILEQASQWNKKRCRIFTFGVGYDVNTILLDQLSQTNKGLVTYVKPKEDIEVAVSSLYDKISDPVLSDLQLDFGDIEVSQVYPKELPDLFSGSQLVVFGRYKKGGSALVTLSGKVSNQKKTFSDEFTFAAHNTRHESIPRLWAVRRIGYLMNEIRLKGKNKELVEEIIDLSKRYGILTEYTSFLITDAPVSASPIARETQLHILERNRNEALPRLEGLGQTMGRKAIDNSTLLQDQLQNNVALSTQNQYYSYDATTKEKRTERIQGIKYAGQQAFFNKNNTWISTRFDANQEVIKIKPYSEAYFQLANLSSDIANILALGTQVSFVRNGIMVQVDESGVERLNITQVKQLQ